MKLTAFILICAQLASVVWGMTIYSSSKDDFDEEENFLSQVADGFEDFIEFFNFGDPGGQNVTQNPSVNSSAGSDSDGADDADSFVDKWEGFMEPTVQQLNKYISSFWLLFSDGKKQESDPEQPQPQPQPDQHAVTSDEQGAADVLINNKTETSPGLGATEEPHKDAAASTAAPVNVKE